MFDNLSFYCPKKELGCNDKIKYNFYFEHIYNSCQFNQNSTYKFCKNCKDIYISNTDSEHKCSDILENDSNISYLEKTLNSLYENSSQINSEDSNKVSNQNSCDNMIGNIINNKSINQNNKLRSAIIISK
jgi:hypothetical protein